MDDIGFNDNLELSKRKFHFQTASNSKKGEIRCEIFENGQVLATETVDFERRSKDRPADSANRRIEGLVEALHQEMMSEIELLFLIADKVRELNHGPSFVKMGMMFLQNNMIDDAIKQFQLAIKTDPEYVDGYLYLGQTYNMLAEFDKAVEVFTRIEVSETRYADFFNHYGYALLREGNYQKALKEIQKALKINPSYLEAHYNLSLLYFDSAINDPQNNAFPPPSIRYQRGLDQLEKIYQQDYSEFDRIYDKIMNLAEKKEYHQIVKVLIDNRQKMFKDDSINFWGTGFFLKFMYGERGLDNEIIKKYEQRLESFLKINDRFADIWNNLGVIHLIQCRNLFLQALNEFKRSLEINPNYEKAKKNKKLVENDGKEFLVLLKAILK